MKAKLTNYLSDMELIDRVVRLDDGAAYRALVERHQDYAFTIALRLLDDRHDAEEAAQDAFVRAFRALASFEKNSKFTTWFYRIVVNCALAIRQKRRPAHQEIENSGSILGGGDFSVSNQQNLKNTEQKFHLNKAIAKLGDEEAAVISLFYLKEHSLEEVAEILQIEIGNVKVKLHRARKKMAILLENQLGSESKNLIG